MTHTFIIPGLGRQREGGLQEVRASLVYSHDTLCLELFHVTYGGRCSAVPAEASGLRPLGFRVGVRARAPRVLADALPANSLPLDVLT